MKKEKTGREVLGGALFADPFALNRREEKLAVDAAAFLRDMQKAWPEASPERLRRDLHTAFDLVPLEIHALLSIRIEMPRRDYLNDYRCWMSGHLAEAVVPYSGSGVFWKARPNSRFEFGLPGHVGPSAVRLRTFLDGKDLHWFEEHVEKELASAREALDERASTAALFRQRTSEILDRVADQLPGIR